MGNVLNTARDWMADRIYTKADIADVALPVVAAAVAALTTVLWEFAPTEEGWSSLTKLETIGALVATVTTGVVALIAAKRSLTTRAEARGAMTVFSNALTGASDAVADLLQSKRSIADCNRFVEAMLREATTLMPIPNCRAALYGLEEDERTSGDNQYLKRIGRAKGRSDDARPEFRPETDHGKAIIDIVKAGAPRYVPNYRAPGFTVQRDEEAHWRSFAVVPVATKDGVWGALFLDSDKLNDFTHDQKSVARSIARFMEIGIDLLNAAASDLRPELDEALHKLDGDPPEEVSGAGYDLPKNAGGEDG